MQAISCKQLITAVGSLSVLMCCLPAVGSEPLNRTIKEPLIWPATPFQLTATYDLFPTELVISEKFKLPKKMDSALVKQIGELRSNLPGWSGCHILTPGVSRTGE